MKPGLKMFVGILITMIAALLVVVFVFDPTKYSFYPPCIFKKFTGFDCPGCGSTRAVHALLHGDLPAAANYNLMLVAFLPMIFKGLLNLLKPTPGVAWSRFNKPWYLLVIICAFWLLRNIHYFPFTYLNSSM